MTGESELEAMAQRLLDAVRPPLDIDDTRVAVGASIGIAMASPGIGTIDALLDAADRALYTVKASTKGRFRFGIVD